MKLAFADSWCRLKLPSDVVLSGSKVTPTSEEVQMRSVLFAALASLSIPAAAADLHVNLISVQQGRGPLLVTVQKRQEFMQDKSSYGARLASPTPGDHSLTIKNVVPGDYAVSVWHDIDGDGAFSKRAHGMPLDGWAMVNGETLRSEPTFDQVKTSISGDDLKLPLRMQYYANQR